MFLHSLVSLDSFAFVTFVVSVCVMSYENDAYTAAT